MKRNQTCWLVACALSGVMSLSSRAQDAFTLEELRQMALQHNVRMRNAENDVEAAQQGKKEAFTNFFPQVSATGMGYNANKGLMQMNMGEGMNLSMLKNGIMGGVTLTQPLFAGGQIVNANRLADVGLEVSRLQQKQCEDDVVLSVEQQF